MDRYGNGAIFFVVLLVLTSIILVAWPWIISPIRLKQIYRNCPEDIGQEYELCSAGGGLAAEIAEFAGAMAAMRFTAGGHWLQESKSPRYTRLVSIWMNPTDGDSCTASFDYSRGRDGTVFVLPVVAFCTEYEDGIWLVTSNTRVYPVGHSPAQDWLLWPRQSDLRKLYALHRFRIDRRGFAARWFLPPREEAADYYRKVRSDDAHRLHAVGYTRRAGDGTWLLTWRGAIRIAWSNLVAQSRSARAKRSRELAALLEDFNDYNESVSAEKPEWWLPPDERPVT